MRKLSLLAYLAAAVLGGCGGGGFGLGPSHRYVKPSIAVMKFDSRAAFPLGWDLGDGMRDILVDRLVATGRFHVMERPELDAILGELRLQNSGVTRKHRRAAMGRLKNVKYLVKGTVTDFAHVSRKRGLFGLGGLSVLTGKNRAVMGMTMYVVDVESGEIVCSESIQKSVRAGDLAIKAEYKNVSLGGTTFYRTPLGRATAKVIEEAVKKITRSLAAKPWQPRIAKVRADGTIVLNGGADRAVEVGAEYQVLPAPEKIIDPDTGDVIGRMPGPTLGRIRVARTFPAYSIADVLAGQVASFKVGQLCRKIQRVAAR